MPKATTTAPFPLDFYQSAQAVLDLCRDNQLTLVTAESCTGGMVSGALTAVPGSSAVIDRGFVTYSNEAKMEMLGVPEELLNTHGAVSPQTADAMAVGALGHSPNADVALSITGIAGPGGGSPDKPVGLVYMAVLLGDQDAMVRRFLFAGSRAEIRHAAVNAGLDFLLTRIQDGLQDLEELPVPDETPG
ncbi:MAG: CinA family protein [Rhodospirillaceae bacterium]